MPREDTNVFKAFFLSCFVVVGGFFFGGGGGEGGAFLVMFYPYINSRVSDQNAVSLLCIMLEIHHFGREPSNSE